MSVKLEVAVADDLPSSLYVPAADKLQQWADSTVDADAELEASLRIVGSEESRELNREYRDKDSSTNVLSFPMQLPDEVELPLLGDLAVCAQVVADEAEHQGKAIDAHWAHMIVHGMLHLQGYDHIESQDAELMESLEISILHQLGFPNPYLNDD